VPDQRVGTGSNQPVAFLDRGGAALVAAQAKPGPHGEGEAGRKQEAPCAEQSGAPTGETPGQRPDAQAWEQSEREAMRSM
jgi:hypothetical protein